MPTQNRSQVIGREGERWFQSFLPPEWSIQRPVDDFGNDGIVAVGTDTQVTSLEFGVQIKSSLRFKYRNRKIIVPKITRDNLYYWARKFYPTLIVAYDTKTKIGYFEWASNLVSADELDDKKKYYYLHISTDRAVSDACWPVIKAELQDFHTEFLRAFQTKFEIVPIVNTLASLLRNLCTSATAERSGREGEVLYITAQAWTHIEVVRQLDTLIPETMPDSIAYQILSRFRETYFRQCEEIFVDFAKCVEDGGAQWILIQKPELSEPILQYLTAMLSECVCGLLDTAIEKNLEG